MPGYISRTRLDFGKLRAKLDINASAGRSVQLTQSREQTDLYLDLMKRSLTGWSNADKDIRTGKFDPQARQEGRDWPEDAPSMIGFKRLDNLRYCIECVLREGIPGDLIETGVWRGGASIFMRAILKAYCVEDRNVWVADSFQGLPEPDPRYPADHGDLHHTKKELAVSLKQVRANFRRYNLLDEQVMFLKGWFADTLPEAPIQKLAVARLDGDMYGSTMDAISALYPKLSTGGFLIVDDYGAVPGCRRAIEDYRGSHGLNDEIIEIDWGGVYWRKTQ